MKTRWESRYAQRLSGMSSSIIRELLKLTQQPDIISFAGGLPAPEVFPTEAIQKACTQVLQTAGKQALQYSTTEGYLPLRKIIAEWSSRYGIHVEPDNILITSGSQQGLDLIGRLFLNRGDSIVVESPTYLGALQAWNAYGAQYIAVPIDDEGMRVEQLEKALQRNPKFIYVLPNFQNPAGVTLPEERRRELVRLADQYGVPIVEDDPYGKLRYEGEHVPPVLVMDNRLAAENGNHYQGNVIYLGTFSKILAPGLRLAWIIAPKEVIRKLVQAKQGADLHTATFNQFVAYEMARRGVIDAHIKVIRATYKERRDTMLAAMEEFFPDEVRWTRPAGGMFLWVVAPPYIDTTALSEKAIEKKVAYVPGAAFHTDGSGHNTMRVNYSFSNPETIREGIQRLGQVLKEAIASHR
jgi:2-aminoadipate transaminase